MCLFIAILFGRTSFVTITLPVMDAPEALTHLFAGDILKVFLHHDLPQTGFDLTLRQLSLSRSAETMSQYYHVV